MKKLYTSPLLSVEELTKIDILCDSTEKTGKSAALSSDKDNINQSGRTMYDMTRFLI